MLPRTTATFLALLSLIGCTQPPAAAREDESPAPSLPNILLVYADDMGYGDLAVQNPDSRIPTPNLDRLAAGGMRFTDAHSSSGICTPSRYALLTGRYHWRKFHGIVTAFGGSVFEDERLTLPEMLQARGYATACIGKWHLGWDWDALRKADGPREKGAPRADEFDWTRAIPDGPLEHGFDHYFGDDVPNFPPYAWIRGDRILEAPSVPFAPDPRPTEGAPEGRKGPMVDGWKLDEVMPRLTREAVAWIHGRRDREEPFFLYFPWTSPHAPIVPAEGWKGSSLAGAYGDFVAQSDDSLGQVLEALESAGFAENTLVIFTSDNGPEHYAYPRARDHGHESAGPLRGLKRDIFEGGHRVPFLIRWPGEVRAGSVNDALVSQIDLMATIATIVGFELQREQAEDSHDLLPLLRGSEDAGPRSSLVHNTRKDHFAIRERDWVLIDAPSGAISKVPAWVEQKNGYSTNPHEGMLFDLTDDLGQRENLFAQEPERVDALRARLHAIRNDGHSAPRLSGE